VARGRQFHKALRWARASCLLCALLPLGHAQAPVPGDPNLRVSAVPAAGASATRTQQRRMALVIGNAAYRDAPLANPVNDARAIAQALRESGFAVTMRENADQRAMVAALREFGDHLRGGGTGLFYYAGHGMQIKGRNYLIPVGADIAREDEVAYAAVDAQAVLDKMEAAGNPTNIMILDACRNNPFARASRGAQPGLAQMDAPVGTLVAYSTSPGKVASDGTGANGLYTQHLLDAIRQPDSKVEDVFKRVRTNVRRDSQGSQVPWEATSLEGDFYFRGGPAAVVTASTPDTPGPAGAADAAGRSRYVPGDRWTFQTDDLLANKQTTFLQQVTSVADNGEASINGGAIVYSSIAQPRYIRYPDRERFFDAGYQALPSQWRVGVKEPLRFEIVTKYKDGKETRMRAVGTLEVVAQEKLRTPAGEFLAWRLHRVVRGTLDNGTRYDLDHTHWYVPEVKRTVQQENRETNLSSGKETLRERTVLQAFSLATPVGLAGAQTTAAAATPTQAQAPAQAAAAAPAARPAPATNPAGFTTGDRWRFQVVDKFKGEVVRNYAHMIDAVLPDGSLQLNKGALRWDARGNPRFVRATDRERSYSVGYTFIPAQLQAGAATALDFEVEHRLGDARVLKESVKGTMRVTGQEKVRTPAGEFTAWRVEIEAGATFQNIAGLHRWLFTGWYLPELRNYVAFDDEARNASGAFERRERHELTSFQVRGAEQLVQR